MLYAIDVNFPECEENNFGSRIFLVSEDKILIYKDGVFFRAKRFESVAEETEKRVKDFNENKTVD